MHMTDQELYSSEASANRYDKVRVGHPEVIKEILRRFPLPDRGDIADVGCGTGNETALLTKHAGDQPIWGIDRKLDMLENARKKIPQLQIVEANMEEHIPLPDNKFSYIFSSFTYHHMKSPKAFFSEVYRLLEPDGRFVLLGATLEQALSKPLAKYFPQIIEKEKERYLPKNDLISTFQEAGFASVETYEIPFENRVINEDYLTKVSSKERNSALTFLTHKQHMQGLKQIREDIDEGRGGIDNIINRTAISGLKIV